MNYTITNINVHQYVRQHIEGLNMYLIYCRSLYFPNPLICWSFAEHSLRLILSLDQINGTKAQQVSLVKAITAPSFLLNLLNQTHQTSSYPQNDIPLDFKSLSSSVEFLLIVMHLQATPLSISHLHDDSIQMQVGFFFCTQIFQNEVI